ncbi:L-amino acid N-acyltransferase YncA [Lentzea atacamensis]|uniref:L-amino acid N-acyltransferase YncA n=1 Tax=Lentzea atacamensis TaxID=531938 RepID=A0ABX9E7L8_9PSEU|nr:GNAT family N-acetyltransferase [Lentzea atacamensis]RAS64067.1 L-amino acid N-acyltransferase YncA [Lentzea atacamensis]
MTVRLAEPADALAIASVRVRSWRTAYRGQIPDEVLDNLSLEERIPMWERASRRGEVWVGLDGDQVVGFICTGPSHEADAVSQLYAIYLLPSAWGTGLALPLAEAGLAGLTDVVLWVLEDNQRARRFYERLGFTADGTTREEIFGDTVVKELRYRRRG